MNRTKILFSAPVPCWPRCWYGGCRPGSAPGRGVRQAEPLDVIMTRTSIRAYRDCPVGADTVELLLRAAMAAPSAVNRQPWAFVVVDDWELLRELAGALPFAKMTARHPGCGRLRRLVAQSGGFRRLVGDGCLGGLGKPAPCGPCAGVGSRMDWGLSPRRTGRGRAARAGASRRCRPAQPDSGGLSCGQSGAQAEVEPGERPA